LKNKERNNSSILRYLKEDGVGILFCSDLEIAFRMNSCFQITTFELSGKYTTDYLLIINGLKAQLENQKKLFQNYKSHYKGGIYGFQKNLIIVPWNKDTFPKKT
jgi:hypothetical protein